MTLLSSLLPPGSIFIPGLATVGSPNQRRTDVRFAARGSTSTVFTGIYLNIGAGLFPLVLLLSDDIEKSVHGKQPTESQLYG